MWIYTTKGFISVVQDKNQANRFCVRARDEQHLVNLGFTPETILGPGDMPHPYPDYPYRVFIEKSELVSMMADEISAIEYPDFKTEVKAAKDTTPRYAQALGNIWSESHHFEIR